MSISIILPIYNGCSYLAEAIDSVFKQTYSDWKLYLVDDGSKDSSIDIIKLISDSRIVKVFNDRNYGLYGSLNRMIESIETEWVVILMQDDLLKPSYLEEMLDLVNKFPDTQAFWATEDMIDSGSNITMSGTDSARIEIIKPSITAWIDGMHRGCFWIISGSFTHKKLLTKLMFKADLPHCADYDWLLRVLRESELVYYERVLSEIRTHEQQASATNLRSGKDIREAYRVIKANFLAYSNEIPRNEAFSICVRRARLSLRRGIGALFNLNIISTLIFIDHALKYLALPFYYRSTQDKVNT